MTKRALGWFGLAVVCAIAPGCKSKTDQTADPIAQDQLPAAVAKAVCDSFGSCCSTAQFVFDSTNCGGNVAASVRDSFGLSSSGAVQYDAQAAGDCLEQIKANLHCGNVTANIPACSQVTVGTLAAGELCMSDDECKSPGVCTGVDATGHRVCEAFTSGAVATVVRGGAGAACSASCNDEADCQGFASPGGIIGGDPSQPAPAVVACYRVDGLACLGAGTCQPLGALGADCSASSSCKDGLFCDGNVGRCTAPHPNGASCTGDAQCQSQSCLADTHVCATTSVTAQACANGMP